MSVVNMLDVKSNLSRIIDVVESRAEKEIVIARGGPNDMPISGTTALKHYPAAGFEMLAITAAHAAAASLLPARHGDPFDRLPDCPGTIRTAAASDARRASRAIQRQHHAGVRRRVRENREIIDSGSISSVVGRCFAIRFA